MSNYLRDTDEVNSLFAAFVKSNIFYIVFFGLMTYYELKANKIMFSSSQNHLTIRCNPVRNHRINNRWADPG